MNNMNAISKNGDKLELGQRVFVIVNKNSGNSTYGVISKIDATVVVVISDHCAMPMQFSHNEIETRLWNGDKINK